LSFRLGANGSRTPRPYVTTSRIHWIEVTEASNSFDTTPYLTAIAMDPGSCHMDS
jgi:hypothetical protein